jgi:hypothetical protein
MENNNNQKLDLDRFEGKCINDYVQFLLSFYHKVLPLEKYIELKGILYSYILKGNFEEALLNSTKNSTNLQNFFTRNGKKLRDIPMIEELVRVNREVAKSNMPSPKKFSLAIPSNNNVSLDSFVNLRLNHNPPKVEENLNLSNESSFASRRRKKGKSGFALKLESQNFGNNSSPLPTKLRTAVSTLSPFNRRKDFVNIKTAGEQSNMMKSKNGKQFFKTLSLHNSSKKRQFENECRVYSHLQQVNPHFLRDSTCFLACYSDGILLSDGGMSLSQLLESNRFNQENLKRNLQQFFPKVLVLHCSGVSHNDLHCHNVVGFDKSNDVRFIDFGLAKTCQRGINTDFLERLNNVFTKIFFAFARKYGLF